MSAATTAVPCTVVQSSVRDSRSPSARAEIRKRQNRDSARRSRERRKGHLKGMFETVEAQSERVKELDRRVAELEAFVARTLKRGRNSKKNNAKASNTAGTTQGGKGGNTNKSSKQTQPPGTPVTPVPLTPVSTTPTASATELPQVQSLAKTQGPQGVHTAQTSPVQTCNTVRREATHSTSVASAEVVQHVTTPQAPVAVCNGAATQRPVLMPSARTHYSSPQLMDPARVSATHHTVGSVMSNGVTPSAPKHGVGTSPQQGTIVGQSVHHEQDLDETLSLALALDPIGPPKPHFNEEWLAITDVALDDDLTTQNQFDLHLHDPL